ENHRTTNQYLRLADCGHFYCLECLMTDICKCGKKITKTSQVYSYTTKLESE
ncbi:hypothetical protein M153_27170003, partial [Pseudoloma neurophilia]